MGRTENSPLDHRLTAVRGEDGCRRRGGGWKGKGLKKREKSSLNSPVLPGPGARGPVRSRGWPLGAAVVRAEKQGELFTKREKRKKGQSRDYFSLWAFWGTQGIWAVCRAPGLHSSSMCLLPCRVAPSDPSPLLTNAGCYGYRGQGWAGLDPWSISNTEHSGRELLPGRGAGPDPECLSRVMNMEESEPEWGCGGRSAHLPRSHHLRGAVGTSISSSTALAVHLLCAGGLLSFNNIYLSFLRESGVGDLEGGCRGRAEASEH